MEREGVLKQHSVRLLNSLIKQPDVETGGSRVKVGGGRVVDDAAEVGAWVGREDEGGVERDIVQPDTWAICL